MAKFVVEQINAGKIERSETLETTTPIKAAEAFAEGSVTFRRHEAVFIKVTPAGAQQSFQFVKD